MQHVGDNIGYCKRRKERETNEGLVKMTRYEEKEDEFDKHRRRLLREKT